MRRAARPWIAVVVAAATAIAVLSARADPAAPDPAAARVVAGFHEVLLSVMRDARTLGYRGRYERLAPSVTRSFHLRFMIALITGYHWRKMTPEQKDRLTDAFSRMTISTYARRFDGYDGERFETDSAKAGPRNSVMVNTRLVKSDGQPVVLNYRLMKIENRWGIIDIHLAGKFSEVATKRSEYSSVLRRKGFDVLVTQLNRRIAGHEKDPR